MIKVSVIRFFVGVEIVKVSVIRFFVGVEIVRVSVIRFFVGVEIVRIYVGVEIFGAGVEILGIFMLELGFRLGWEFA